MNGRQLLTRSMSEGELQAAVVEAAELLGFKVWHDNDSRRNEAGWPDLVLCRERVIYAELKSQRGRIRPEQERWLNALREAGQEVWVWRPEDWTSGDVMRVLQRRNGRPLLRSELPA